MHEDSARVLRDHWMGNSSAWNGQPFARLTEIPSREPSICVYSRSVRALVDRATGLSRT